MSRQNTDKFKRSKRIFNELKKIFLGNKAKVAIFMSGGGSNARNILSNRYLYPNVTFSLIFTDSKNSSALQIANEFGLEYLYKQSSFKNSGERELYFMELGRILEAKKINVLIYAGFMKIVTDDFLVKFPGINSHPANLTITDEYGKPKYIGMEAIKKSLIDKNKSVCCTIYVVDNPVDSGIPIALSSDVTVSDEDIHNIPEFHERLKKEVEWIYYPKVIQKLSKGELSLKKLPFKF